jgi:hypothetical protein
MKSTSCQPSSTIAAFGRLGGNRALKYVRPARAPTPADVVERGADGRCCVFKGKHYVTNDAAGKPISAH